MFLKISKGDLNIKQEKQWIDSTNKKNGRKDTEK